MRKKAVWVIAVLSLFVSLPFIIPEALSLSNRDYISFSDESGKHHRMKREEVMMGAVLSMMGEDAPDEAYKAAAVVVSTIIVGGMYHPNFEENYLICDVSQFSEDKRLHVTELISAVDGQILLYDGKPITAAFHESSGGSTVSYESIFGEDKPYLRAVESDKVTENQLITRERLRILYGDDSSFSVVSSSEDGAVKEVLCSSGKISGEQFRNDCGIYSTVFTISEDESGIIVTSYGLGHQVGLSLSGAKEKAEGGSRYDEILLHYYSGAVLGKSVK